MKIAIVGAGLGGLTAAICFSKAGHEVVVFEKQPGQSPTGGILGLRPSALRVLYEHGLREKIEAISQPLGESQFKMLPDGKVMRTSDLHEDQVAGEGLMLMTVRQKLAKVLYEATMECGVEVKYGVAVEDFEEDDKEVKLTFEDGSTYTADMVLAADGIRSRLRSKILADIPTTEHDPVITDATFYVFHIPATQLNDSIKQRMSKTSGPWMSMSAWIGKDTWAMSAFDSLNDYLNLGLAIVEPTSQTSLWNEGGDVKYVQDYFQNRACEDVRESLNLADHCDRWRLAWMPDLPRWTSLSGRVALLGDAAHAILPNGGAGITLTMEDIGALNYLFRQQGTSDIPKTLRLWNKACKPRSDKLREFGCFNMRRLEGDKEALALTQKAMQEEAGIDRKAVEPDMNAPFSKLAFSRWLSGYDPVAAAEAVLRSEKS
ncbi:hypothetical protein M409DRAFT_27727 [Zasmidium cellare ATCC 36951]|uniref:FAD-binding domain-containing protein n=1 Tax=Zasmidium cellare ATCC 36951 TaxID=1080233 RepID=A0A6A6C7W7_ZASCE|nr:uncharacterized protein M409DRAFT_27727 [Zasmidium cellare ATCC 36951]KAF2162002.1 hypothetical protein M409DRAFT_27727 [Zasmidium cellare ATCC 36951]